MKNQLILKWKTAFLALGMGAFLFYPMPAMGALSTSFTLTSPVSGTLAPFAVGHVFKQGDVPNGSSIGASLPDFQATIKSRWPDGSAQYALLAGRATLQANVPLTVNLNVGSAASGTLLTESDLAAQGANALINFSGIGSVQLSSLIGQAGSYNASLHQWGPGKVLDWIQGPEMSSWIYSSPVGSDASLSAWFEVRLWRGGAVEILPWIENGYLLKAGAGQKTGTVSVTIGGASRFSQNLTILHHTRTVLCSGTTYSHWLGTDPRVTPRHNTAYMQQSKMVPTYGVQVTGGNPLYARLAASYSPFAQSNFPPEIGSAGYDGSIGLLPEWDVAYLASSGDPRALSAVVINAYSAGRYGIHYRDENTNRPFEFSGVPNIVLNSTNAGVPATGASTTDSYTPAPSGGTPPSWATSHAPSVGYMAYLTTGRFYFMEETQFAATLVFIKQNDSSRLFTQGVLQSSAGANLTRGAAWGLRSTVHAYLCTPDNDPLKIELRNSLDNNVEWYHSRYVAQPNHPQGVIQPYEDYTTNGDNIYYMAIWMEDFFTASLGYLIDVQAPSASKMAKAMAFFEWKARSIVGRLGAPGVSTEFDFRDAAKYNLAAAPSDSPNWASGAGPWYANWGDVYRATLLKDAMTPNSAPPNTLQGAYFPEATSYWGNLQPAISYAVALNAAGASQAYARMTGASNWPQLFADGATDPVWMVVPNNIPSAPPPPNAAPANPRNLRMR